jgi:hypothetical protein
MLFESLHNSELHDWHEQSDIPLDLQNVVSTEVHKSVWARQPLSAKGAPLVKAFIFLHKNYN